MLRGKGLPPVRFTQPPMLAADAAAAASPPRAEADDAPELPAHASAAALAASKRLLTLARDGDVAGVAEALANRAWASAAEPFAVRDSRGDTVLHWAAKRGHRAVVEVRRGGPRGGLVRAADTRSRSCWWSA
jgi:hypothetical protein